MTSVIDTSALLRLYIPDGPVPDGLEKAMREAERENEAICAPELLFAEAGQVLHKKRNQHIISTQEMTDLWHEIASLPIRLFSNKPLIPRAMDIASQHHLTVYDALFLALCETHTARFFTADKKLMEAARQMSL